MSSRSHDSRSSAEAAAASGTTFAAASRRLNRRFTAYLDQTFARRLRRRRIALAAFGAVSVCLGCAAAFAAFKDRTDLWPILLTACLLLAVWVAFSMRSVLRGRQELRRLRNVAQGGIPVNAFLIQASSSLFAPQTDTLPCLVLVSFQPEVASDLEYMRSLARRVFSMKNTHQPDPDGRYIASLPTDERAVPYRRRLLPYSFTDGSTIYCADLWLRPSFLKGGCLQDNILPCLAEPGPSGGIELIPWWLLSDTDKPSTTASSSETESSIA